MDSADLKRIEPNVPVAGLSRWQRVGPVITLLLLAPVISEVLYGATRISFIFALVPEIGAWGCGALLIRYVVRRRHLGWPSTLLLALALAIAEECVIQQTSLAPLIGLAKNEYGRVWGVNWVYFVWALVYESVWVVMVPVQLTELIFSSRRNELWLGSGGLMRAYLAFGFASFTAWFMWTKRARVKVFHMPPYDPPLLYIGIALAAIVILIVTALGLPSVRQRQARAANRHAPHPRLVGRTVCVLGLPWGALVLLGFGAAPWIPFKIVIACSIAWAAFGLILMRRWSSSRGWQDPHRFSAVFGALMACMLAGFVMFWIGGALRVDWIGKLLLNGIAVVLMMKLAGRMEARETTSIV
jgi:hypothetical protein